MNPPSAPAGPHASREELSPRQAEVFEQLVGLYLREGFSRITQEETAARLRCSKSTIYALAGSRTQLVRSAVIAFFQRAAERVEERVATEAAPERRVAAYLDAVADELRPASRAFMDDVTSFAPAREVYELNTRIAARRVRELIEEGVRDGSFQSSSAVFAAEAVAVVMVAIQQQEFANDVGLTDAESYSELAALLLNGIRASSPA